LGGATGDGLALAGAADVPIDEPRPRALLGAGTEWLASTEVRSDVAVLAGVGAVGVSGAIAAKPVEADQVAATGRVGLTLRLAAVFVAAFLLAAVFVLEALHAEAVAGEAMRFPFGGRTLRRGLTDRDAVVGRGLALGVVGEVGRQRREGPDCDQKEPNELREWSSRTRCRVAVHSIHLSRDVFDEP